jgi:uncharacterized protein YfeS
MQRSHYIDDPERGLSRETSHPRFVELASEDFYYDYGDGFSPFGNDHGADTLFSLQEWYRDGGEDGKTAEFLTRLLNSWGFNLPKNLIYEEAVTIEEWLSKSEIHESYLEAECRARIATAFGQLKIAGRVDPDILEEGLAAIDCLLWFNERSQSRYPNWQSANKDHDRLVEMQAVLVKL